MKAMILILLSPVLAFGSASEIGNCKPEKISAKRFQDIIKNRSGIKANVGNHSTEPDAKTKVQRFIEKNFKIELFQNELHGAADFYTVNIGFTVNDQEIISTCESTYRYWQSSLTECSHRVLFNCPEFKDKNTGKSISADWVDKIGIGYQMKKDHSEEADHYGPAVINGSISKFVTIWKTSVPDKTENHKNVNDSMQSQKSSVPYEIKKETPPSVTKVK